MDEITDLVIQVSLVCVFVGVIIGIIFFGKDIK